MAAPEIKKGSPRPTRKQYKTDAEFQAAVEKWTRLNTTESSPATQSGGAVIPTGSIESTTRVQSGKVRTDWNSFTDGSFNIQEGDAYVGQTPYVTAVIPGKGEAQTPAIILPSPDGKGFLVVPREELLQQIAIDIKKNPNNISYWKTQLQNYYRSQAAFETSLRGGPVTDKDTEFIFALRRALSEISTDNFNAGVNNVRNNQLNTSGFYDVNTWITSRTPIPGTQSESSSTRNFTKRADAIAEFMREVQIQVGDFKLVNNVDALAEAYWQKIKKTEEERMGRTTSSYDPVTGKRVSTSTGYQMPSAQLLQEWRVEFITKGAIEKGKVISTGIRETKAIDLQDAGGQIGDNYTKLKGFSFDYGIRISDEELKKKAAEASLPGGSIDEQKKTIQLASRALYKSLSPYIEGGLKVKDIASQFMKAKADILELSDGSIDIFDPDVQSALSADKLPGRLDYEMQLRANPAYRNTKAFNEGAAGLLDGILKMFGKVG